MSLSNKILGLVLAVFVLFLAVAFVVQNTVVYSKFVALEQEEAGKNVERALAAMDREIAVMGPSAADWATWDDTYAFVRDRNEEYANSNLYAETLTGLAVDVLGIYDRSGELVWGMAYDAEREEELTMPTVLPANLPNEHFLMRALSAGGETTGILRSVHGPLLIAARPVLTSEGEGPPMGMFMIARRLDAEAVSRLATQARVDLEISEVGPQSLGDGVTMGHLVHTLPTLVEQKTVIVGETVLADINGQPVVSLAVTTPREISARGREAVYFSSLLLLLAGMSVLLVLTVILRHTILTPLAALTSHVVAVGRSPDLSTLVGSKRRDELGTLAREFDHMVELLAQARQRLEEQSYRSGIAEMASGVLHNIGNAITPLGVKLTNLRGALQQAPVEEIDLATAELAVPASADETGRRDALQEFVGLAAKECGGLVRRSLEDLDAMHAQVDHVQRILADQRRFSQTESVVESVPVGKLVDDTVRLFSNELRAEVRLEISPSLASVGPIAGSRVKLQQGLSNLLINAAEAIIARGDGSPGSVRIEAWEEIVDDAPMVHLRVTDDGVGISEAHLPRLFEPGFSTKQRGSGMGLHWTANTILAMRGRIFAESDGPGQGASLHLVLPRASSAASLIEEAA